MTRPTRANTASTVSAMPNSLPPGSLRLVQNLAQHDHGALREGVSRNADKLVDPGYTATDMNGNSAAAHGWGCDPMPGTQAQAAAVRYSRNQPE